MRIMFELIGGPLNGVFLGTLDGASTVRSWYHACEDGKVGSQFVVEHQSETGQKENHCYLVTDCDQIDGAVRITAIY